MPQFFPEPAKFLKTEQGKKFMEIVEGLCEDYHKMINDGIDHPTIEFSTSGEWLAEKRRLLSSKEPEDARWSMHVCDTCIDHHGNAAPIHVQLIRQ